MAVPQGKNPQKSTRMATPLGSQDSRHGPSMSRQKRRCRNEGKCVRDSKSNPQATTPRRQHETQLMAPGITATALTSKTRAQADARDTAVETMSARRNMGQRRRADENSPVKIACNAQGNYSWAAAIAIALLTRSGRKMMHQLCLTCSVCRCCQHCSAMHERPAINAVVSAVFAVSLFRKPLSLECLSACF